MQFKKCANLLRVAASCQQARGKLVAAMLILGDKNGEETLYSGVTLSL